MASLSGGTFADAPVTPPAAIATVEHRVAGVQLRPRKTELAVPKGIKGSIIIDVLAGGNTDGTFGFGDGTYVRATLRGASFKAQTLYALPGEPMMLPPLAVDGEYLLDQIELVAKDRSTVLLTGTPSSVPVTVFDKVLVSQVVSRPLSLDEIQAKGIVIDDQTFSAVEFAVGLVIDGETFQVTLPVVTPRFEGATELLPPDEWQERLVEADALNQGMKPTLPEPLQQRGLDFQMVGVNFQVQDPDGENDLALKVPPIPGLMLIPGRIGFLNQFFSVQLFTANAAPTGSGLSVHDIHAHIVLPRGADGIAATSWDAPGDDPLRMARVTGPDGQPVTDLAKLTRATVTGAGADGQYATADDQLRLLPGEGGRAEFLVEGLREGLHLLDIQIDATLDGFGHGEIPITGYASGAVMVRNPHFSLAFSHPQTARAGEPYEAAVTILNTSMSDANLVSISLPPESISGATLDSPATVEFDSVKSGESVTATFKLIPKKTGEVTFSNINSDGSLSGAVFWLKMGVDERGVELSPDAIGYPREVAYLPSAVRAAADRVLGQALSVSVAAKLPPSVRYLSADSVTRKVVELAEAGQRIQYGDTSARVLVDLLLDWQGARYQSRGFDQIIRETDAGRAFRDAILGELLACGTSSCARDAVSALASAAPDVAGRGEAWSLAAANHAGLTLALEGTDDHAAHAVSLDQSTVEQAAAYVARAGGGHWLAAPALTNGTLTWKTTEAIHDLHLTLLTTTTKGTGTLLDWSIDAAPGECFRYAFARAGTTLARDTGCDGVIDDSVVASAANIAERAPEVVAVAQDVLPRVGRPKNMCIFPEYQNYGTVLAVLFSKPMDEASANQAAAYVVTGRAEAANSVRMQPGGRVALVNVPTGLAAFHPRSLQIQGVADPRGHALAGATQSIRLAATAGAGIAGQVIRANGNPAAGVPVLLTYYDMSEGLFGCETFVVQAAQVMTDAQGRFAFDFILADIPYAITAFDTYGLPIDTARLLFQSVAGDQVSKAKLYALANDPATLASLYAAFGVTTLDEALARVQGLDRAARHDVVAYDNGNGTRLGSDIPVALRFRGRGSVTGHVYAIDPSTHAHVPVGGAAVNLYPPHDALESARGMFSQPDGSFAFPGVPLGVTTLDVKTSDGRHAIALAELKAVGAVADVDIELADTIAGEGQLGGRVLEADGVTPHDRASIYVGTWEGSNFGRVIAKATADPSGGWSLGRVPSGTWDLVALSFDGKRYALRQGVVVSANLLTTANLVLPGKATVTGVVQYADGTVAPGATVVAGPSQATTDSQGRFELSDIPTGPATVMAGIGSTSERPFPRIGGASVEVVPGASNTVAIRFASVGAISGCVTDQHGAAVPNVKVSIPRKGGFAWVQADKNGCYLFAPMPLGPYFLSAPAPPVFENDVSGILASLGANPSNDQLLAAIGEAYAIFAGVNDPLLTGAEFNPLSWGFTKTTLSYDGQVLTGVNIRYESLGSVAGTVRNGQGTPIGAEVRLTGIGPDPLGALSFVVRGEQLSDPALGTFAFDDVVLPGSFGLQAATPFYATVATASGIMDEEFAGDITKHVDLTFPPDKQVNGALGGLVLDPAGKPLPGARVRISFGDDYAVQTNGSGEFCTLADCHDPDPGALSLPAINSAGQRIAYTVWATYGDYAGTVQTELTPGGVTLVTVQLRGAGGLEIAVQSATGKPVTGAELSVTQIGWPGASCSPDIGNSPGTYVCDGLPAGPYAITAKFLEGQTWVFGRAGATVLDDQIARATVTLGGTAALSGHFVAVDQTTPIADAQVTLALGGTVVALAATDAQGRFTASGLPLGTYTLTAQNPVTGAWASGTKTLAVAGANEDVTLVEQALGKVYGVVWSPFKGAPVAGAEVVASFADPLTPSRSVTSGADGVYTLPASPPGAVSLQAIDPTNGNKGSASAVLPDGFTSARVDVNLAPLANLRVRVLAPDGVTPMGNAEVTLGDTTLSTCADPSCDRGTVLFPGRPLGDVRVQARDLAVPVSRTEGAVTLADAGATTELALTLPGAGKVTGHVVDTHGAPCTSGLVTIAYDSDAFLSDGPASQLTDASGAFTFAMVPVTPFHLQASCGKLGAWQSDALAHDGQVVDATLVLAPAGTAEGRLLRADGTTPAANVPVVLSFASLNAYEGRATATTDAQGHFAFAGLPAAKAMDLSATLTGVNPAGLARASKAAGDWLEGTSDWTLAFGDIVLDEAYPTVLATSPADGATDAPAVPEITVTFSEPLGASWVDHALTSGSLEAQGLYLVDQSGAVVATRIVDVASDRTTVTLEPVTALASQARYDLIALAGARYDVTGGVSALGPTDRVDRSLVQTFHATFAVADVQPPVLLSLSPDDGAAQVDPSAVVRLSFDEAIVASTLAMTVTRLDDGTRVAGTVGIGGGGLVAVFTPTSLLKANAHYQVAISGLRDAAGNLVAARATGVAAAVSGGALQATFKTVDTAAPSIQALTIVAGLPTSGGNPEAGARIRIQATLAPSTYDSGENGLTFALYDATLQRIAASPSAAPDGLFIDYVPPASGSFAFFAKIVDRYGNEGPLYLWNLTVDPNAAPSVAIAVQAPSNSGKTDPFPIEQGQTLQLRVTASDLQGVASIATRASGVVTRDPEVVQGASQAFALTVPADAAIGSTFVVSAEATDVMGLTSAPPITATFVVTRDRTPPKLASWTPSNAGLDVQTSPVIRLTFDEPLLAASVKDTIVTLAPSATPTKSVAVFATLVDSQTIAISPLVPLATATSYVLTGGTAPTDRADDPSDPSDTPNVATLANGNAFKTLSTTFTTTFPSAADTTYYYACDGANGSDSLSLMGWEDGSVVKVWDLGPRDQAPLAQPVLIKQFTLNAGQVTSDSEESGTDPDPVATTDRCFKVEASKPLLAEQSSQGSTAEGHKYLPALGRDGLRVGQHFKSVIGISPYWRAASSYYADRIQAEFSYLNILSSGLTGDQTTTVTIRTPSGTFIARRVLTASDPFWNTMRDTADLNDDGVIDALDLQGDFNADGKADSGLAPILYHRGYDITATGPVSVQTSTEDGWDVVPASNGTDVGTSFMAATHYTEYGCSIWVKDSPQGFALFSYAGTTSAPNHVRLVPTAKRYSDYDMCSRAGTCAYEAYSPTAPHYAATNPCVLAGGNPAEDGSCALTLVAGQYVVYSFEGTRYYQIESDLPMSAWVGGFNAGGCNGLQERGTAGWVDAWLRNFGTDLAIQGGYLASDGAYYYIGHTSDGGLRAMAPSSGVTIRWSTDKALLTGGIAGTATTIAGNGYYDFGFKAGQNMAPFPVYVRSETPIDLQLFGNGGGTSVGVPLRPLQAGKVVGFSLQALDPQTGTALTAVHAGVAFDLAVSAVDENGQTRTDYTGELAFGCDQTGAVFDAEAPMSASDRGRVVLRGVVVPDAYVTGFTVSDGKTSGRSNFIVLR